ncbi:MAG: hypothetical protein GY754_10290, partial [bacterium]|nr:hypothetical protein [bacterium]
MDKLTQQLIESFEKTFEDRIFSRPEKRALAQILREENPGKRQLDFLRSSIFDIARNNISGYENKAVLEWLETANKLLIEKPQKQNSPIGKSRVYFSPGNDCLEAIQDELSKARKEINICVFTISDDRIANRIIECRKKGVHVKLITDDDKRFDTGSDIDRLSDAGIEVRIDRTSHHMHHKFTIIDEKLVITGSYNWTRSAAAYNNENILVTEEKTIATAYMSRAIIFPSEGHLYSPPRKTLKPLPQKSYFSLFSSTKLFRETPVVLR